MRADQLLILGVAGLGLYALYRMGKAKDTAEELQNGLRTEPRPRPDIPTGALPERPGIATLPANVVSTQGSPIQLTNSRAYFGRIETVSPGGEISQSFPPNAPRADLINALASFGFDGVRVYMSPEEASQAIEVPEALQNAGRGTRWFYGRWTTPTTSLPRPPEWALLWVTRGLQGQIGLLAPGINRAKAQALGMCNSPARWRNYHEYLQNCRYPKYPTMMG